MVDIVDSATRSRMMAGIRGRNTRPEVALRRALHRLGFRFRIHVKELPGKPDIVLRRHRAAVLVHGCFWHRHAHCRFATTPATRPEFWEAKFDATIKRDAKALMALHAAGWRTATVWECAMRARGSEEIARQIGTWLVSHDPELEIGGDA